MQLLIRRSGNWSLINLLKWLIFRILFIILLQTGLSLTGGNVSIYLPTLYHLMKHKTIIAVRNSITLKVAGEDNSEKSDHLQEVNLIVENVKRVVVKQRAFDQVVINAVFKDINSLQLEEKSFASCWGSVWLFNIDSKSHIQSAFSSSEIVVWKDFSGSYASHARPKVTPRQRFALLYEVSSKLNDLGKFIYNKFLLELKFIIYLIRYHYICHPGAVGSYCPHVDYLNGHRRVQEKWIGSRSQTAPVRQFIRRFKFKIGCTSAAKKNPCH